MKEVAAGEKAQEQFRQAQKMETSANSPAASPTIQQSADGGDGQSRTFAQAIPDDPRARRLIDGAFQGAERGASLTQRMLAFARQQDLQTRPVDLRALVNGMMI